MNKKVFFIKELIKLQITTKSLKLTHIRYSIFEVEKSLDNLIIFQTLKTKNLNPNRIHVYAFQIQEDWAHVEVCLFVLTDQEAFAFFSRFVQ